MGFLDQIEKLINEHGSAVILKERIALANDKYSGLEVKAKDLETTVNRLEIEVARLTQENQRLERSAASKAVAAPQIERLDEIKDGLLVLLSERGTSTTREIVLKTKMTIAAATFNLEILYKMKLVGPSYAMGQGEGGTRWHINHEGRDYLHRFGLLM